MKNSESGKSNIMKLLLNSNGNEKKLTQMKK